MIAIAPALTTALTQVTAALAPSPAPKPTPSCGGDSWCEGVYSIWKNQALAEVYEKTADLATSVAEKIIRRNLNPEDQRDLVARSLEQLQTVSKN